MLPEAGQLVTDLESLSLDDADKASSKPSERKSRLRLVDCRPWPPLEEVKKPQKTGIFYYGIYLRKHALEKLAVLAVPHLAGEPFGSLYLHGLNAARWIADDPSMAVQFAFLQPRHKEAMPFITEKRSARILCLFKLEKDAVAKRMEAEKVERLARDLDCKPDWYEVQYQ